MSQRTVLVLALLVAALGAFIWFVERDLPSTEERSELSARVVPVETEKIEAIEIERRGERVRIERSAGGEKEEADREWEVVAPVVGKADVDKVDSFLGRVTTLDKERTIDDVDPSAVGLDEPQLTVVLETSQGSRLMLEVGREVPATDSIVLRLDGRDVHVGSGAFVSLIDEYWGDWRSRDLVDFDHDAVVRISATGPSIDLSIVRRDGRFVLEEPVADEAEEDAVAELLTALDDLDVVEFVDEPKEAATLGLEPPSAVVELELEGLEPIVLKLGTVADETDATRYMALADRVCTVTAEVLELLGKPESEWQSTAWTKMSSYDIQSIVVREQGEELTLGKSGADWLHDGTSVAYTAVADLIDSIVRMEATGVVPRDVERPEAGAAIEIDLESSDHRQRLFLTPAVEGGFVALSRDRDFALRVSEESASELFAALTSVREELSQADRSSAGDETSASEDS